MIDLAFLFSIYSVLGWIVEVVFFFVKTGKLQKRGILHGAYCPLYGFSLVVCTAITANTINNLVLSFFICALVCTIFELITGVMFDKILNHKMWDYSNMKYNLNGYICLPFSIIWGVSALLCLKLLNPFILSVGKSESLTIKTIVSIAIIAFMFIDLFSFIGNKKTHHNL